MSRKRNRRQIKSARNAVNKHGLDMPIGNCSCFGMRRFYLTWLVWCEHLAAQNCCTFIWRIVHRNSDRSNWVIHRSWASHFPRKTFTKHSRILFQRANSANTSARTGFPGIELQIPSDLLCQWICSVKRPAHSFTASTLKGIRVWWCQGKGSFEEWIGWSTRPRSSFCPWRCFRDRNFRVDPKIRKKFNPVTRTDLLHYCEAKYSCSISRGLVNSCSLRHRDDLREVKSTSPEHPPLEVPHEFWTKRYVVYESTSMEWKWNWFLKRTKSACPNGRIAKRRKWSFRWRWTVRRYITVHQEAWNTYH
jgi:hypothetical protein